MMRGECAPLAGALRSSLVLSVDAEGCRGAATTSVFLLGGEPPEELVSGSVMVSGVSIPDDMTLLALRSWPICTS